MAAPSITVAEVELDLSDIAEYLREWDGCEELPTVEEFFDNEPPMRATDEENNTMAKNTGDWTGDWTPEQRQEVERMLRALNAENLLTIRCVTDGLLKAQQLIEQGRAKGLLDDEGNLVESRVAEWAALTK